MSTRNQTWTRLRALPAALVLGLAVGLTSACGGDGGLGDDTGGGDGDAGPRPDAAPLTEGLSTLAGHAEAGYVDGPREVALFDDPVNVIVGPDDLLYVADFNNHAIRRVTSEGLVTTLTKQPKFERPFGLAFGPKGQLYVTTDRNTDGVGNGALWEVDMTSGKATLLVDNAGRARSICVRSDGRLVLPDYQQHVIRIYDPKTNNITPVVGSTGQAGFADGAGAAARFNVPYDCVIDMDDVVIISDYLNHRLRRVTLDGDVSTVVGGAEAVTRDGPMSQARFVGPQGLALAPDGTLYVADSQAFVIRRIKGDSVTTIAGDGMAGYIENVDPLQARFFGLEGIDVTPDGRILYIADGDKGEGLPYHRVRRLVMD